jgi:hypothetical protein
MAEKLVDALFEKSLESCKNCWMYSKIDLDKRDRYNEYAMDALQAIVNNEEAGDFERVIAQEALDECGECQYESTRIADKFENEIKE